MDDVAERTALRSVCMDLPELLAERERLPVDRQDLIDRIRGEAAARRPILSLLAQLVGTSRAETVRSLNSGLPGVGAGRPDEERFVCPDDACDRVVLPDPGGPLPRCNLIDRRMKRA